MNKDILEGNWKQLKGHSKEWWGQVTDDEWDQIEGRHDRLVGKLQERYGYTREEAEEELNEFLTQTDYEVQ